jgi:hypothetical protein
MDMTEYQQNFTESLARDLARVEVSPERGIEAIVAANGKAIAYRQPASVVPESLEAQLAAVAIRVATIAAGRIAAIEADADHSDDWKLREAAKISEVAAADFAAAKREIDAVVDGFAKSEAADAVAPPLTSTDIPGALVDDECRAWMRSLSRDEQVALGATLQEPQNARLLAAMMRSPLPLPVWLAESARNAWAEARLSADPQMARLRRQASERVTWLATIGAQAEAALPRVAGTREAQFAAAKADALKDRS